MYQRERRKIVFINGMYILASTVFPLLTPRRGRVSPNMLFHPCIERRLVVESRHPALVAFTTVVSICETDFVGDLWRELALLDFGSTLVTVVCVCKTDFIWDLILKLTLLSFGSTLSSVVSICESDFIWDLFLELALLGLGSALATIISICKADFVWDFWGMLDITVSKTQLGRLNEGQLPDAFQPSSLPRDRNQHMSSRLRRGLRPGTGASRPLQLPLFRTRTGQ